MIRTEIDEQVDESDTEWFDESFIAKVRKATSKTSKVLRVLKYSQESKGKLNSASEFYNLNLLKDGEAGAFAYALIRQAVEGGYIVMVLMWLPPDEGSPFRFVKSKSTGEQFFFLLHPEDVEELKSGKWIGEIETEYARLQTPEEQL